MTLKEARQSCDKKIDDAIAELRQAYIDCLKKKGMYEVDLLNAKGKRGRIIIGKEYRTHMPKYEFHVYMSKGRLSKVTTGYINNAYDLEEQLDNKFIIVGNEGC